MKKAGLIVLWLVLFLDPDTARGLTGPNCQVESSRQLTATDKDIHVRNNFGLIRLAAMIYQEIENLKMLEFRSYEDTRFFCCRTIEMCSLVAPPVNWSDSLIAQELSKLGAVGLIHDVKILALNMRPGFGTSTTTNPTTTTATTTTTTTTTTTREANPSTGGSGGDRQKRDLQWRSNVQLVCLVGGVSGSNARCRSVLARSIQASETNKREPDLDNLVPGKIYVLIETGTEFRLEPLSGRQDEPMKCQYVTRKNAQYYAYEELKKAGIQLMRRILGQLELVENFYSQRIPRLAECESAVHQLISCTVNKVDCMDLATNKEEDVKQTCRTFGAYRRPRTPRNLLLNIFLYDYQAVVDNLILSSNTLALNQERIHKSLQVLAQGVSRLQSRAAQAMNEIKADISELSLKIFHLNGITEMKNFVLALNIRREQFGRELVATQANLLAMAGRFTEEINILINLLRGETACKFTENLLVVCSVSAGVVTDPNNNGLVVLSKGENYQVYDYRGVNCLPKNNKISKFSGGFWLANDGYLVRGEEKYRLRCLFDSEDSESCEDTMATLTEENEPLRLFRDQDIYYLYRGDGLYLNHAGDEGKTVVVRDKTRALIEVTNQPVFVGWASFPLTAGGETVRRTDLEDQVVGLGQEMTVILKRFIQTDYVFHLDGFLPESTPSKVTFKEIAEGFPELIRTNPVVQSVSGAAVAGLVIIAIMTTVCCIFSQKCRESSRAFCCCCCDLGSTWSTLKEAAKREKETWDDYVELRRQSKAHRAGILPKEKKKKKEKKPKKDPAERTVKYHQAGHEDDVDHISFA